MRRKQIGLPLISAGPVRLKWLVSSLDYGVCLAFCLLLLHYILLPAYQYSLKRYEITLGLKI